MVKILFVCHGKILPNFEKCLCLYRNPNSEITFTNGLPTKPESHTCNNKQTPVQVDSTIGQVFFCNYVLFITAMTIKGFIQKHYRSH